MLPIRQTILDAAYSLFLQQGYAGTSMRQIAQKSGLALGGLYNHFASKEEIFQQLILLRHPYVQVIPLLNAASGSSVDEFLRNAAQIIQREMASRPDFIKLMLIEVVEFGGAHFPQVYETVAPLLFPLLQRFNAPQMQIRALSPALLIRTLMGTIVAFYLTEALMDNPALPAELRQVTLDDFMDIYLRGIKLPAEPTRP